MNENKRKFAEALASYTNDLMNGFGWQAWQSLRTTGSATVNMSLNPHGNLVVEAVETHEQDVISLEKELKEAKKTIRKLESQIEKLTPKEEETIVTQETPDLLIPQAGGVPPSAMEAELTEKSKPTRTRRKRAA